MTIMQMKRSPEPGEPKLVHVTVDSGHSADLALDNENFNPTVVAFTHNLMITGASMMGYTLRAESEDSFSVWYCETKISDNTVRITDYGVVLTTKLGSLAGKLPAHVLSMAADLEQCAALGMPVRKEPASLWP